MMYPIWPTWADRIDAITKRLRSERLENEAAATRRVEYEQAHGVPVFREPAAAVADLAIAYPVDDRIGFTLTVAGKPQKFEMTREAAAHFAGRIAEALSK
jgi:hypothetical protein